MSNTTETDAPPRYKAALNGSWAENYGANAKQGGVGETQQFRRKRGVQLNQPADFWRTGGLLTGQRQNAMSDRGKRR